MGLGVPFSLAGVEPFHAWLFSFAAISTLILAVIGVLAAAVIPEAYCQYGCATGALIDHLRRMDSRRWRRSDTVVLALLVFALSLHLF